MRSRVVRAVRAVWYPVAGVVTAAGIVGSVQVYGPVGAALIYLGSAGFGMVMLYAALADGGEYDLPVVRIGLISALVLVVMLGTMSLFPVSGWILAVVMAATCPLVTDRLAPARHDRPPSTRITLAAAREQARVDAAFQQLVESLEQDGSRDKDGT